MAPFTLSRRSLLRGLLGGAAVGIGLPALEIFLNASGTALASGSPLPRRFGIFFWGNGVLPARWVPSTTGADWELSAQLAPLAPVRDQVTVVSGMRVATGNVIPHGSGPGGLLSGAPLIVQGDDHTFRAPSIDQVIAAEIGGETRFASLELGAEPESGLSFNGPHSKNPPESSPRKLFERVFGGGFQAPGDEPIEDPRLGLRRSVLDAVMADATSLRARLGEGDKRRLEQHLEGVRALERRIARLEEDPPDLAACARPGEPLEDYPAIDGRPQLAEKNRALSEVLAMALACDQTRVFSDFLTFPLNNLLFKGATAGHHQLTHDEPGEQPQVHAITVGLIEELSRFLQVLQAVPEGDGTLLDSCAILCTSDVSYARTHSLEDYPILIAGSACGALKTGIHYRSEASENASKVILSLIRAMGIPAAEFGQEAGLVKDGLGAIEA